MNPHLKLAYDHGVQKALEDAGFSKTARSMAGPVANILGGGAVGATAANMALPENATTGERVMAALGGGALGAGGALTGYDRFGIKGALGGAGLASGLGYGLSKVAPEGEGFLDMSGRALASGTQGSLGASLLASSLMPGASLRAGIKGYLRSRMSKEPFEEVVTQARDINIGRPVSASIEQLSKMDPTNAVSPGVMKLLRALDYNTGSPQMAAAVRRYGSIDKIPAGQYFGANLKDTALGTAVGAVALPLALPGQAIAEMGLRESRAEEGDLMDKLKFLVDQGRVPGALPDASISDQLKLLVEE